MITRLRGLQPLSSYKRLGFGYSIFSSPTRSIDARNPIEPLSNVLLAQDCGFSFPHSKRMFSNVATQKPSSSPASPHGIPLKTQAPSFIGHRILLWDKAKLEQSESHKELTEKRITITLPDGRQMEGTSFKTTPYDIAALISKSLAESAVVAKVDGELVDLGTLLESDCTLELFRFDSEEGRKVFWHSSSHLLGHALELLYQSKLTTGPALEEGFYYDSQMSNAVSEADFATINQLVEKIASEKKPFEKITVPKETALEMFKYNPYKLEMLREKVPDGSNCTVYRCGDFIDPCKGPHIPNSSRMKAFAVTKNSSAYFKGDPKRDSLQRVYAISFPDKKLLKEYQERQRLAAERDHRLIGKNQELFFLHGASPGSTFFLPHGTRIYNKLVELLRSEYRTRGFEEVITPNIYHAELWQQSGHWENYRDSMFTFKNGEESCGLKPMNCPGHCLIFGHRTRSYRELPIRIADFGVIHRNELSGALTGLTRVRRFQQDDAHIFCTSDQIKGEIRDALNFMEHIYSIFGFEFSLELSTRPEKFLGDVAIWDEAEKQLAEVLNEYTSTKRSKSSAASKDSPTSSAWKLNKGDGAFYGPKIDIHIEDVLKRRHQCATIQLDFQLPIRFKLEYVDEGSLKRPVMIHRAILGSVERMMAILMEHTGGKWPFWLSPRQVSIIPISSKFSDYAKEVEKRIVEGGFYVDIDYSDKSLQKKIREAQISQYNYILVVGEEEMKDGSVNVRTRDNVVHGKKRVDELLLEFKEMSKQYK